MSEQVLVVPRGVLLGAEEPSAEGHGRLRRGGFLPGDGERYLAAVAREGRFVEREPAEHDPGLKQIIPYALLVQDERVFLLERSAAGGEKRLHRKVSLGVGGHVNPPDQVAAGGSETDAREAVGRALERELHEELVIETEYRAGVVGVINDDSNPVGRVHFGIVYRVVVDSPRVRVREGEVLRGEWVSGGDLWRHREAMETWSQIIQGVFWPGPEAGAGPLP